MFRFFNVHLHFGSRSTAIKILYAIKEIYDAKLVKCEASYGCKLEKKRITNYIEGQEFLIQQLSKTLEATLNYKSYQALSKSEKINCINAIADNLYKKSKNYESIATTWEEIGGWSSIVETKEERIKGPSYSYDLDTGVAHLFNLPQELFADEVLVACIEEAVPYLLKNGLRFDPKERIQMRSVT